MQLKSNEDQSQITVSILRRMREAREKIACLTVYDASFAQLLAEAGVEVLLVGDSLGMVIQGESTTLPVTMDDMMRHTQAVRRGASSSVRRGRSGRQPDQGRHDLVRVSGRADGTCHPTPRRDRR